MPENNNSIIFQYGERDANGQLQGITGISIISLLVVLLLGGITAKGMKEAKTFNNIMQILNLCIIFFFIITGSIYAGNNSQVNYNSEKFGEFSSNIEQGAYWIEETRRMDEGLPSSNSHLRRLDMFGDYHLVSTDMDGIGREGGFIGHVLEINQGVNAAEIAAVTGGGKSSELDTQSPENDANSKNTPSLNDDTYPTYDSYFQHGRRLFADVVGYTAEVDGEKQSIYHYQDEPFAVYGGGGVVQAAGLVFFSFLGFDMLTALAEDTIDSHIALPRGIVGTIVIAIALYFAVSMVYWAMLSVTSLVDKNAPLADAFRLCGAPTWVSFVGENGVEMEGLEVGFVWVL